MRPAINSDNLAFVPYTSGTTGDPKGVMQTHRAVLSSYFGRYDFSSYEAGDRVACNIFFIWEFLRPLLKGGTVYIIPDDIVFLPRSLAGFIRDNDITEILFTPSILQAILNSADQETVRAELDSLRVVWLNGEVVTRRCTEQALNLLSNSTRLFNTYSISETHDVCTVELRRETWDGRDVCPVGFPMNGVTVRILPEGGATFSPVGTGELHIGGSGLARGYLGRADLDRQKFVLVDGERYYSTGDVAEIDSCGMVTITGRNDSMVKIRGYSVYLGGIEETLRKHCDVLDTVVSVEAEDETNKRLIAYVVPKPEATWRVDAKTGFSRDLRHLMERYLPHYMVPSRFLELDELPINQLTGKLDRKALPALPKKRATVSNRVVVPEGAPFEERRSVLRELWSEALGIDYISPDDDSNFFDLGGHSLSGLALTLGIERAFGVRLQGTEVYEYQTLNQLAAYLGDEGSSMESEVSLAEDARLDPDVVPSKSVVCERLGEASSVLITGATGFLGAFLLDELLKASNESTKFYCLTRDKESGEGLPSNRVLDTLRFYGLPGQAMQDRIIPITGDLTKSQFGLSDAEYEHLSQTIDLIFHCAASVNYVYTYSAIKPHTVGGTREVIKFACHSKTKPIQYISSNGIFPGGDDTPYLENNDIDGFVDRMEGGYNQAKWVAERLMWQAMSRGLPVCMFRPGNIGHHSVTGVVNPNDFQTLIIIACLRSGCAPVAPEWLFEMTPVDFLATFVARIADEPANLGNVYNIVQQEPVPADQVFTHMKSNGFVTELVSIAEWKARLEATAERDDDVELKVLSQALDLVEPYLTDTSTYDNTRFREALSQLALLPPVVDLNYVTKILKAS
jgi:thioester reductase-like protein